MKPTYQLYLRLKMEHKEDYLSLQLQKRGFKLVKNTGSGIEQFRNYFFELEGALDTCEVALKLMPGKNTTQTISITLTPDIHPKHVEHLFNNIEQFAKSIPLDLLDLQVRNRIYEQLHKEGKVNAFYVGLPDDEQQEVERQAYIPINYKLFAERNPSVFSVGEEVGSSDLKGERAPDLDDL